MNMRSLFALGLVLVALTACGSTPEPQKPVTKTAANVAKTNPPPPEKKTPPTPNQQASLPKKPEPEPVPVNDNPLQFMELGSAVVSEIVGRPHFVRRDGTAEVWQYRGDGCFLDLFLYPGINNIMQVKYVDLRSTTLPDEKLRACLADIIRAKHHTKPTS